MTLEVLTDQREARLDGAPLTLGARAFDVLAYLDAHSDRVVSKAELLDHVWSGMIVEEGNLSVQIAGLRKALGKQRIKTVPGVGYQLAADPTPSPETDGPAVPDVPSLAVLPFANLTGSADKDYLVDGIVTEIIGALGRVGAFFVTSSTSTFTYRGRVVDLAEVGRELGVRYLVEGSIQASGDRIRIFTQLVEAATSHTIWQDRFDGTTEDIFNLQDAVAENVAGALEPKLIWTEAARSGAKPTASLTAYDLCLRATPLVSRVDSQENLDRGLALLRDALTRDPDYTHAKALICFAHSAAVATRRWTFQQARVVRDFAYDVLNAPQAEPLPLSYAGHYLAYVHNEHADGMTALSRAERLNPNSAVVAMLKGWAHIYREENEAAITCLTRAKRLSPLHPQIGIMTCGFGNASMQMGALDQAIAYFEQALTEYPGFGSAMQGLMSCYHEAGRSEDAARIARMYREYAPNFTIEDFRTHRPFDQSGFAAMTVRAMRAYGFPETGGNA